VFCIQMELVNNNNNNTQDNIYSGIIYGVSHMPEFTLGPRE